MDTKIKAAFWTDSEVEALNPHQKLTLLWLLTNSRINLCGILQTTPRQFAFETGLPQEVLWETVKALPRALKGFEDKGIIYCRNFIRHQFGSGNALTKNNIFRGMMKAITFINHSPLLKSLLEDYPELSDGNPVPSEGLPKPFEGVREEKRREERSRVEKQANEVQQNGDPTEPQILSRPIRNGKHPVADNPPDTDAVLNFAKSNPGGVLRTDICMQWMDARARDGWKTKRDGHLYDFFDWQADLRSFHRAYLSNENDRKSKSGPTRPRKGPADCLS